MHDDFKCKRGNPEVLLQSWSFCCLHPDSPQMTASPDVADVAQVKH